MDENIKRAFTKAQQDVPPHPCVPFRMEPCRTDIYDNKIGGIPYLPKTFKWPVDKEENPLVLLAQINFTTIPHLPNFPDKGILQFYIAPNDMYGVSENIENDLAQQQDFRILYHEDIITDRSKLYAETDIPKAERSDEWDMLPFEEEYRLIPEGVRDVRAHYTDCRFSESFLHHYNEMTGEDLFSMYDLSQEQWDDIDALCEDVPDVALGGHVEFVQEDPRTMDAYKEGYDTCLLHLMSFYDEDSGASLMWGDYGSGNFLIARDALRRCDFKDVLYNFDCG